MKKIKGGTTEIVDLIVILIMIFLAVMIYFLYTSRFFNVHAIIAENEVRRHNINLGKSLLGSPLFLSTEKIYNTSKYSLIQPNVTIEKRYAEYLIFNKSILNYIFSNQIALLHSYPNSLQKIDILNLENGKEKWSYIGSGKIVLEEVVINEFYNCVINNIRPANILMQSLFKILPLGIVIEVGDGRRIGIDIFDSTAVRTCFETHASKIFSDSIYSINSFPLILYDSNSKKSEIGRMVLQTVEVS